MVARELIFVRLVVASLRQRGPAAWRAWVLPPNAVALYAGLAGYVRLGIFGPSMGTDYRYVFDSGVFMTLGLGLAFLPLANSSKQAAAARSRRRPAQPSARSLAAAAAAVFFIGFLVSMNDASKHWAEGEPGRFSRTFRRTVASACPGPDGHRWFFHTVAPQGVIPEIFSPYNKASYFLPILLPGAEAGPGRVPVYMVSVDGSVHRARLGRSASANAYAWTFAGNDYLPGTPLSCAAVTSAPLVSKFQLDHRLPTGHWFLLLTYTGAHNARVHLAINTGSGDDIDATGNCDSLTVTGSTSSTSGSSQWSRFGLTWSEFTLCLAGLDMGRPVPVS